MEYIRPQDARVGMSLVEHGTGNLFKITSVRHEGNIVTVVVEDGTVLSWSEHEIASQFVSLRISQQPQD